MNKRELIKIRKQNWYKYHIPRSSPIHRLKMNAIFISTANSLKHELKKTEVCYKIKKKRHQFITEAETCKGNRRVDVVDIDDGKEYEIEIDKRRAKRFKDDPNVIVIMVEKK